MKKFEILEHTADIKVLIYGENLSKLFENATLCLMEVLSPKVSFLNKVLPIYTKREIKLSSYDLETLLVDYLSEVNYNSEKYKEVYEKVEIVGASEANVEAILYGKKVKRFKLQVKGVTFYGLKVEKENGIYKAQITFDI